jgi:hypothetical protein
VLTIHSTRPPICQKPQVRQAALPANQSLVGLKIRFGDNAFQNFIVEVARPEVVYYTWWSRTTPTIYIVKKPSTDSVKSTVLQYITSLRSKHANVLNRLCEEGWKLSLYPYSRVGVPDGDRYKSGDVSYYDKAIILSDRILNGVHDGSSTRADEQTEKKYKKYKPMVQMVRICRTEDNSHLFDNLTQGLATALDTDPGWMGRRLEKTRYSHTRAFRQAIETDRKNTNAVDRPLNPPTSHQAFVQAVMSKLSDTANSSERPPQTEVQKYVDKLFETLSASS